MNMISRAICFATEAFDGQYRKGDKSPAIFHSLEAAVVVQSVYPEEEAVCAAVLHDTVEDTDVTIEEIREKFGERVAFLVSSETEEKYSLQNPSDTWLLRKQKSIVELMECTDIGVKAMWLGDKLSNMRSFAKLKELKGEKMWESFNQKNPEAHKVYYTAIAEELTFFKNTDEYKEYVALIRKVFGE